MDSPEPNLGIIRKAFDYFDLERRGYIHTSDFGKALRWLKLIPTEKQIEGYIKAMDPRQTGRILFDMFYAAASQAWDGGAQKRQNDIWHAFMQFDETSSGLISASEMKKILTEYGLEPIPEKEANHVIRKFANKKTNQIEYVYMIRAWQQ
ncbi:Centrin-2 [Fasciolopsis buskii]|uniref:Centrin-2 n=1 Tax=Fasciolopsis buskii TaxID=27845 RepID=A0A8E0VPJ6_9TREM|nr:Centrin-2 [Fasciolopsis buski]